MKELYVTHLIFTLGDINQQRHLDIETLNKMFHSFKLKLQHYIKEENSYEYEIKQSN